MDTDEEDDLQLVKASAQLLSDLEAALPRLLWRKGKAEQQPHRYVKNADLDRVISLIEPFQGEPQLLDAKLKVFLPPLISAFLRHLIADDKLPERDNCIRLHQAAARILYIFCKVRGEKVIAGFLNNEPQYLDVILGALEDCSRGSDENASSWHLSYILLLWLRHLLLAPFDLTTVSNQSNQDSQQSRRIPIPSDCPDVMIRIVSQADIYLQTHTREQDAAAKMLVRFIARPDVQKTGLHTACVQYACQTISSAQDSGDSTLGLFKFLVGVAGTLEWQDNSQVLLEIMQMSTSIHGNLFEGDGTQSGVLRKLFVKLVRNTAITRLKAPKSEPEDSDEVVEEVANYLMAALSDRDTQVRSAAAKAMGQLVSKLDADFPEQLMDAILEDYGLPAEANEVDYSNADVCKWHGFTLTLAYLLFQRSFKPENLQTAIGILVKALNFEKRSSSGNTEGVNIRDAACFAIWSMSRRYTTRELEGASISALQGLQPEAHETSLTTIQFLAIQLICSSCLDPSGNVRRGCSAALQEMIGRHPDKVPRGITLIQIIDYQAVGLRRRAMTDLVLKAAELQDTYWSALLDELQGWRGIGSLDIPSRERAAESIGHLCAMSSSHGVEIVERLWKSAVPGQLDSSIDKDTTRRLQHGALLALASIATGLMPPRIATNTATRELDNDAKDLTLSSRQPLITELMVRFTNIVDGEAFHPLARNQRMDTQGIKADVPSAIAVFLTQMLNLRLVSRTNNAASGNTVAHTFRGAGNAIEGLLLHSERPLTTVIPGLIQRLLRSPDMAPSLNLASVMETLNDAASRQSVTCAAAAFALATAVSCPRPRSNDETDQYEWQAILGPLVQLVSNPVIEWRVVGLRALVVTLETLSRTLLDADHRGSASKGLVLEPPVMLDGGFISLTSEALVDAITPSLDAGLNDYTINERGDVGSLARIQALNCIKHIWSREMIAIDSAEDQLLAASVLRLSLEKLDRVRVLAAQAWQARMHADNTIDLALHDVSSEACFKSALAPLLSPSTPIWTVSALIRGLASANAGAEPLLQASRAAFIGIVQSPSATTDTATFILTALSDSLSWHLTSSTNPEPLLSLLAFALDSTPLIDLATPDFSWRILLSRVQKAHFKSSIVSKLIAAVEVYRSLARVDSIREEVIKKLFGMAKTNPFPRVRYAAAEALWVVTGKEDLMRVDWMGDRKGFVRALEGLEVLA
ncbi:Tubulin folding cofactor D-like protein [Elsinoe fawcettii]|nr:Tubulin folding cofactor D-like protein [Elsinoe fawcettii]